MIGGNSSETFGISSRIKILATTFYRGKNFYNTRVGIGSGLGFAPGPESSKLIYMLGKAFPMLFLVFRLLVFYLYKPFWSRYFIVFRFSRCLARAAGRVLMGWEF